MDSDIDGWVHIDPDNPAGSSDDDAGVLALSSGCTTPDYFRSGDEDDGRRLGVVLTLSSATTRRARSPSPDHYFDDDDDVEGLYDPDDAEEEVFLESPPQPKPLSGLFHHTLEGAVDYAAFDPVRGWPARELVPDPSFSECREEVLAVLASARGLVCLRAPASGVYIVANPATCARVRLPLHSCNHHAYGDPAVVIAFEGEQPRRRARAADHRDHYHVVVAFPLQDGIYAFESFSSRTWTWTVGAGVCAVEQVVAASGVAALGRAFWRTTLGYILCYDPAAGADSLLPAPLEVLQWPNWELGEMNGTLSVTCMDDRVNEVVVINLHPQLLLERGEVMWTLAGHFEGGCMRNRDGVQLLRSQGPEVVFWDPTVEIVVAMDVEGRATRSIGPLSGRQYYSDFIPYVRSSTRIEAGAEPADTEA